MRSRDRILKSLEASYREPFSRAKEREDADEMSRLDLEFQRDQIHLEVLLDIRDLLAAEEPAPVPPETSLLDEGSALIEKAGKLRRVTRLR
jgi:hypothetical protein